MKLRICNAIEALKDAVIHETGSFDEKIRIAVSQRVMDTLIRESGVVIEERGLSIEYVEFAGVSVEVRK